MELYLHSLQQQVDYFTSYLCRIFRICLVRGYIPKTWSQIGVTFIPKPKKAIYTEAKECFPVRLSSCMLKMVEKLHRHIRGGILGLHPLHQYLFAYQQGKSIETTLHHVITHTEEALENRMLLLELSKILRELLTALPLTS
jgi:hypothetical protein